MSEPDEVGTPAPKTPDELRAEIEKKRAELAHTVDALSDKLNVKAQAKDKIQTAKHAAPEPVQRAAETAAPYRKQIALGAVGAVLALLVVRRVRSRRG